MANERLYQFPSKAMPVPADIIYAGDSAAAFDEVQITIAQLISAYPNLSGIAGLTLGANTYPYSNSLAAITAGTITALGIALLADANAAAAQTTLGYQATPIASQFAGWDSHSNLSANNFNPAYATTATAASTTTLTVASAYYQFFTGTTTQTVVMPVTSTLAQGQSFYIVNNSTGVVTVESSGTNTIIAMAANTTALVTCILTSGTSAASWNADYAQSGLSLPVSLANGGTGQSLSSVNSAVFSTTSGGAAQLSATLPAALTIPQPNTVGTTTNNNAAAGSVGEFVSSVIASGSAVSYSTGTPKDMTSISLTAGDWDVWGNIFFIVGGAMTASNGWISATSATLPDVSLAVGINVTGLGSSGFTMPMQRFSLSGTTTIYISAQFTFSTSTVTACGGIYARRIR